MAESLLIVRSEASIIPVEPFDELVALAGQTVAPSSARVYQQTYTLWRGWCVANGVNLLDLRPVAVLGFLSAQNATKVQPPTGFSGNRLQFPEHSLYLTGSAR